MKHTKTGYNLMQKRRWICYNYIITSMRIWDMKKFIYVCMLSFILLFSGCANKPEAQQSPNSEAPESEKTENPEQENEDNRTNADTADTYSDILDISNPITEDIDLSDKFGGIKGCAVIYDPANDKYSVYNTSLCEQEASPYSTFKIISTLAGLNNGVIQTEQSTMNYSGEKYPSSEWNDDLSLEKAFQTSCIWYFRQIIDEVGHDEIQSELISLEYGNCDISEWDGSDINPMPDLNGFWLGSSLKISPLEQVQILKKIFEGESIYSDEHVGILKGIMAVSEDSRKIYGKTGSGPDGEAWFVGFAEENDTKKYFAVYLSDNAQPNIVSGSMAKEIALNILE